MIKNSMNCSFRGRIPTKKGQLTLWIFMALRESKKYVDEIKTFIVEKSGGTIRCEEQSLYRALRKMNTFTF